jgi:hypothetical protein
MSRRSLVRGLDNLLGGIGPSNVIHEGAQVSEVLLETEPELGDIAGFGMGL